MFKYEKMLEYPVNIKSKDLRMAKNLITQLGGAGWRIGCIFKIFMSEVLYAR